MTDATLLAAMIRKALQEGYLHLAKTCNASTNAGKAPSLVLAELLIKQGAKP